MLHLLLVVDWVGALALADWKAPEDEESFDQEESDVRDAVEYLDADIDKRDFGPWLFTGSWGSNSTDDDPEVNGEWRRLTAEEAVRWATEGRLWPQPAYLVTA